MFVKSGIRRGIIRSLFELVGAAIAICLALYISSLLSDFVYTEFIRQPMIDKITDTLVINGTGNTGVKATELFNRLPILIQNSLKFYGITSGTINDTIMNATGDVAVAVADIFAPVIISLIKTVFVSVVFMIIMVFVKIIVNSVCRVCKLPIIREVNSIFGAMFGGFKGMIIICLLMLILRLFLPLIDTQQQELASNTIESTYVFKQIYNNNPAYKLFDELRI